jgi:chromosome segregation ATPase
MYFIREYEIANSQIHKAEFHRKHKKVIREDMRREYDKATETTHAIQARIDAENKKDPVDDTLLESLTKQLGAKQADITQFKQQIDHIDSEIQGYTEALDSIRSILPLFLEEIEK